MTPEICGVILAGGLARRMGGGDKSLLTLGGRPVLDRVIERLRPQVSEMALNANGDPRRFAAYDLTVLADTEPDFPGPLAGVLAGLDWAASRGASHVVSVAADSPFFPTDLVNRFWAASVESGLPIALAATDDPDRGPLRQPTFGLWPVALCEDLRAAIRAGARKIVLWADRHGAAVVGFPAEPFDPFFNLNRPEDMVIAERLLDEQGR